MVTEISDCSLNFQTFYRTSLHCLRCGSTSARRCTFISRQDGCELLTRAHLSGFCYYVEHASIVQILIQARTLSSAIKYLWSDCSIIRPCLRLSSRRVFSAHSSSTYTAPEEALFGHHHLRTCSQKRQTVLCDEVDAASDPLHLLQLSSHPHRICIRLSGDSRSVISI